MLEQVPKANCTMLKGIRNCAINDEPNINALAAENNWNRRIAIIIVQFAGQSVKRIVKHIVQNSLGIILEEKTAYVFNATRLLSWMGVGCAEIVITKPLSRRSTHGNTFAICDYHLKGYL